MYLQEKQPEGQLNPSPQNDSQSGGTFGFMIQLWITESHVQFKNIWSGHKLKS